MVLFNVDLFCFNSTANIICYEDIVLEIQLDVFFVHTKVILECDTNLNSIIDMINQIINLIVRMHISGKAAANV